MNSESMDATKRQVLSEITQTIFTVSDHVPPSQEIDLDTMLIADLALESIEVAAIFTRLHLHYAGSVSIADFIMEMVDAGRIADFPVGAIVDFIAGSLPQDPADTGTAERTSASQ